MSKSRKVRHAIKWFGTYSTDGHNGKEPAPTRKLRRGDKPGRADRVRPEGTGAGTSCEHTRSKGSR